MMRHLKHRTSQVRNLVFSRDAIFQKSVATAGTTGGTEGSGSNLAGPPVSFGYETSSYAAQNQSAPSTNTAYHQPSPEIVLAGVPMLQSPITSRSGTLGRSGHRITGSCTFYAPSLDFIKALDNFSACKAFSEFESFDKLYDIERIIYRIPDNFNTSGSTNTFYFNFGDNQKGYEMDRLQFKIKAGQSSQSLTYIRFWGNTSQGTNSGANNQPVVDASGTVTTVNTYVNSNCSFIIDKDRGGSATGDLELSIPTDKYITIDIPIRLPTSNLTLNELNKTTKDDYASIYVDGVRTQVDGYYKSNYDPDKFVGFSNATPQKQQLSYFQIVGPNVDTTLIKDIYLYKEAQWRIQAIKEYRDEYMQISAVRVRGERASRRRAYAGIGSIPWETGT